MGSSQLGGAEGRNPTAVDVTARWRVLEREKRPNCAAPTAVAGPSHGPWPEKQGHTRTGQERQGEARPCSGIVLARDSMGPGNGPL